MQQAILFSICIALAVYVSVFLGTVRNRWVAILVAGVATGGVAHFWLFTGIGKSLDVSDGRTLLLTCGLGLGVFVISDTIRWAAIRVLGRKADQTNVR